MRKQTILVSMIVTVLAGGTAVSAEIPYNITWLTEWDDPGNSGFFINDSGQVAGQSGGYAFLWEAGGTTELEALSGGTGSWAMGINDYGQIAGGSYINGDQGPHGFFWENGGMIDIGGDRAVGINNSGQVLVERHGGETNSSGRTAR